MQFYDPHKKDSTITTQVMCAIVFWLFSLAWLFWFQNDMLMIIQHVLSEGKTHYDRTIGALLVTTILYIVQLFVARFLKLYKRTHALTYLPSMLLLAMLCDYSHHGVGGYSGRFWLWMLPVILLLWGVFVWVARQALPFDSEKEEAGLFSRRVWLNMFFMLCQMLAVVGFSNTNAVFHYRCRMESLIMSGNYDEALTVGIRSDESDASLMMLRAFALSKKGQLGEHLFEYPVVGDSKSLLPLWGSSSTVYLIPHDEFYRHLGARPIAVQSATRYFDLLEKDSLATRAVADYRLCGLLIDKDLDQFARLLPCYYTVDSTLPKHYREAVTLYMHQRSHPVISLSHAVADEDWKNLQELERAYPDKAERKGKVAERYKGSYWYYYFYN